jgi:predicted phosphohydrolase
MDFQFCSDLHLEFGENREWLRKQPLKPAADLLILAGDLVCLSNIELAGWFLDWVSENFKETYWVPGNHEYYHSSISNSPILHQRVRPNVHLVDNISIDFGDVAAHFTTLWTDIPYTFARRVERQLSDFHVIKAGDEQLTAAHINALHAQSKKYLIDALSRFQSKKQLVVSHHVPTYTNYPEQYTGSVLNSAFAVEMKDLIEEFKPVTWIYGHSHINVAPFKINTTELLTNQLGYSWRGEGSGFENSAVAEI